MKNRLKALQIQCCFTSTETIRTIRDVEPRTATSTFTQLLTSAWQDGRRVIWTIRVVTFLLELTIMWYRFPDWFGCGEGDSPCALWFGLLNTPTNISGSVLLYVHRTIRLIRDGEPKTATSTFTLYFWALPTNIYSLFVISISSFSHRRGVNVTTKMKQDL